VVSINFPTQQRIMQNVKQVQCSYKSNCKNQDRHNCMRCSRNIYGTGRQDMYVEKIPGMKFPGAVER